MKSLLFVPVLGVLLQIGSDFMTITVSGPGPAVPSWRVNTTTTRPSDSATYYARVGGSSTKNI